MSDVNRPSSGMSGMSSNAGTTGTMSGTRRWEDFQDTYRSDWETRYGKNKPWDQHQYAYRYGWEAAQQDRWQGRDWQHAESDVQTGWHDWNSKHMHGSDVRNEHKDHPVSAHPTMEGKVEHVWDNIKDTVKEGWDRARMGFDR